MRGGFSLFWILAGICLLTAVVWGAASTPAVEGPPKAQVDVVEETIHGHKIVDPYRWLEDANSAASQEYVRQELAYTRSILDPLPGRDRIHQRLTELLSIGTIASPQIGGPYFFYTRREGTQNQPVLLVREGAHGKDRALVDVNQMASDGTVALDWWFPSDDGKYVAYGTSPSGSEISTLHVIETATGKQLPDSIEHTVVGPGAGFRSCRTSKSPERRLGAYQNCGVTSVWSSICLVIGLPWPWPALVSILNRIGRSRLCPLAAWACINAAIFFACMGSTRLSLSAVMNNLFIFVLAVGSEAVRLPFRSNSLSCELASFSYCARIFPSTIVVP